MPSDLSLKIDSEFDSSGLDEASSKMEKFGDSVGEAGKSATENLDPLFKRIERPLGAIAFSGVANELVNMGGKGESATIMLEHGLHAVGNALMFMNPALGIAVVSGAALFEVFEKINHEKTTEEIQKETKATVDLANEYKDLKTFLESANGARKDELLLVQQSIEAKKESIKHELDDIEMKIAKNREFQEKLINDTENQTAWSFGLVDLQTMINKGKAQEIELLRQKKILTDAIAEQEKKPQDDTDFEAKKKIHQLKAQEALKEHIADDKEAAAQEIDIIGNMTQAWSDYARNMGQSLVTGGDSASTFLKKIMADQLKIVGDGLVQQLTAKVLAWQADPMTAVLALGAIAAISAIEALTGGSGGGASTSAPAPVSGPSTTQMTMVNVNFQGGRLDDPGAIAILMKGINKQVVQNNGQIVVTNVTGNGPPPAGMLA